MARMKYPEFSEVDDNPYSQTGVLIDRVFRAAVRSAVFFPNEVLNANVAVYRSPWTVVRPNLADDTAKVVSIKASYDLRHYGPPYTRRKAEFFYRQTGQDGRIDRSTYHCFARLDADTNTIAIPKPGEAFFSEGQAVEYKSDAWNEIEMVTSQLEAVKLGSAILQRVGLISEI